MKEEEGGFDLRSNVFIMIFPSDFVLVSFTKRLSLPTLPFKLEDKNTVELVCTSDRVLKPLYHRPE